MDGRFRLQPSGYRIVQVSPVQSMFRDDIIDHMVAEIVVNEVGALTLRIVCPAPKGLISHF